MKFQWYVINLDEGTVYGHNDVDVVRPLIEKENFVVLTAQHGKYYNGNTNEIDVKELSSDTEEEYD